MTQDHLRSKLLEKVQEEYRNQVLDFFLKMDKAEFVWYSEAYLRLKPFYQELHDQLTNLEMSRESLLHLLRLENTLDTVFAEYQGSGISNFINDEFMSDIRDSFMHDRTSNAPQLGLCFN